MAPMFGFKDRMDYRRGVSSMDELHKIRVPCFFLHAEDDIVVSNNH